MKMTVEIELDWIGEDGTVDDVVKQEIAGHVAKKISDDSNDQLMCAAEQRVAERIDAFVNDILNRFMNHEIRITDNYGDTKARYDNVEELLKERFDTFLTETVDSRDGSVYRDRCGYGKGTTRIDYLIDNRIKNQTDKFMKDVVDEVDKKIKEALSSEMKKKLSDNLLSKIDITLPTVQGAEKPE